MNITGYNNYQDNKCTPSSTSEYEKPGILYQPIEPEQILLPEQASCLAVQAFLKIFNVRYEICMRQNVEFMSPGGRFSKLPIFRHGAFVMAEFEPIVKHLTEKNTKFAAFLDADDEMDMRCYIAMVENIFNMAEYYISYMDKQVYQQITAPRNASIYPWPLSLYQKAVRKANAKRLLRVYQWENLSLEEVCEQVEQCCNSLNFQLEQTDKCYFYGDEPCALDAIVFGHLFAILTMRLPNNALANVVQKFNRLVKFCQFIDQVYFQN